MLDNDNYMVIQGWMRNELGLKGNELMVFALIYGFSQDGNSEFYGSWSYIAEWTGASKRTVSTTLNSLCEKGLLEKRTINTNGMRCCSYKVCKNFMGDEKIAWGVMKKLHGGGEKIAPNNIDNNTRDINNNPPNPPKGGKKIPPTIEEVREYAQSRGNVVDPDYFFDYYEGLNWMRGKTKVKDWQATYRTWERREDAGSKRTETGKSDTSGNGIDYNQFIDVC